MEQKEPIVVFEHQSKKLLFSTPNKFCQWRAKTLLTKEPETIGWIRTFQPEDIFWDIGANVGLYSVYAAIIVGCKTYAFEPESQNFAVLNKNIYFNRLHELLVAYHIGISDQTRLTNLNLSNLETGFRGKSLN